MKLHIPVLFIIILFASCGKKYQCPKENLFPAYIGYADAEIDTIILRRFKIGSNFSEKIDSTILSPLFSPKDFRFYRQGDTVFISPDYEPIYAEDWFNDEYDWQLYNPYDQKITSISDIKFQIKEGHSGGLFSWDGRGCVSPLLSYKRNDTLIKVSSIESHALFIHK